MAERLGKRYDVPVYETPVGFKYVGPKMIETGAMMGGEESGGFGFGMHLPERDGIYTDLMLLDLFLREKAAGRWPVSKAIAHFHEIAGPSFYQRVDVHVDRDLYPALKDRLLVDLKVKAPTELAGQPVSRTDALTTNDGFKFFIADGSWLMVRFSGTEPLVRVYTEATSQDRPTRSSAPANAWSGARERVAWDRRARRDQVGAGTRSMIRPGGPASTRRGWRPPSGRWATDSGPPPNGSGRSSCRPPAGRGGRWPSSGWVVRRWVPTSSGPRSPTAPACRSS